MMCFLICVCNKSKWDHQRGEGRVAQSVVFDVLFCILLFVCLWFFVLSRSCHFFLFYEFGSPFWYLLSLLSDQYTYYNTRPQNKSSNHDEYSCHSMLILCLLVHSYYIWLQEQQANVHWSLYDEWLLDKRRR